MAIPYNQGRIVDFKTRLGKTADKRLTELENPDAKINQAACNRAIKKISHHINTSEAYLLRLKSKCNDLINSKLANATCLEQFAMESGVKSDILYVRPSDFLQKAYTVQTFHEDAEKNINRNQPYINTGLKLARYSSSHETSLTHEQKLFNDFGTVIAAINGAISQLNRTKQSINSLTEHSPAEYEMVFLSAKGITGFLEELTTTVHKTPTILNSQGGILANAYDDLMAMIERFADLYNQLFKSRYQEIPRQEHGNEMIEIEQDSHNHDNSGMVKK